jgi:hypothetical protein
MGYPTSAVSKMTHHHQNDNLKDQGDTLLIFIKDFSESNNMLQQINLGITKLLPKKIILPIISQPYHTRGSYGSP